MKVHLFTYHLMQFMKLLKNALFPPTSLIHRLKFLPNKYYCIEKAVSTIKTFGMTQKLESIMKVVT